MSSAGRPAIDAASKGRQDARMFEFRFHVESIRLEVCRGSVSPLLRGDRFYLV